MILKSETDSKLLAFLFSAMPDSKKTRVKDLLKTGSVSVNGKATTQFDFPVRPGDRIEIGNVKKRVTAPLEGFGVGLVYEDDSLVVVDKPAGLLSVGTKQNPKGTAITAVNDYVNQAESKGGRPRFGKRVFVVHRLDRDVSGLLVFAKEEGAKICLQANWSEAQKEYDAIVEGEPRQDSGTLTSYLTENKFLRVSSGPQNRYSKKAVTHYRVLKRCAGRTLLRVRTETGRKHQIRVQLADIGHPLVGDKTYGARTNPLGRIALHACRLVFEHPMTGQKLEFSVPLPGLLQRLIEP